MAVLGTDIGMRKPAAAIIVSTRPRGIRSTSPSMGQGLSGQH